MALLGLVLGLWFGLLGRVDELPIFDTHLHYNRDQWSVYAPEDVLRLMDQAGVYKAFVSSTPDEGTMALYERAPQRIVPSVRPYRVPQDQYGWMRDPSVVEYVQSELELVPARGIGEFHLAGSEARLGAPRGLVDLSAARQVVLHAHADAEAVEALLQQRPDITVLWAHAGMTASPRTVERLLDAHPNLFVELALRYDVVSASGRLDPAWAAVFQRFPDRCMVGTDSWVVSQWTNLPLLMNRVRDWLRQLPPDVAQAIASTNAERLLGAG
jgi:hypothetical protein